MHVIYADGTDGIRVATVYPTIGAVSARDVQTAADGWANVFLSTSHLHHHPPTTVPVIHRVVPLSEVNELYRSLPVLTRKSTLAEKPRDAFVQYEVAHGCPLKHVPVCMRYNAEFGHQF